MTNINDIVGSSQDNGTKYGPVQHDARSAGFLPANIQTSKQTLNYLDTMMRDLSQSADRATRQYPDSGTTVTIAAVTPDGHIINTSMGDSPLMAFTINAQNKVTGVGILNDLHNPDPHSTNVINEVASMESYSRLRQNRNGKFTDIYDVNKIALNGERIVLVAASDGLLDKVGNAPKNMSVQQGIEYIVDKNIERTNQYKRYVEKALSRSDNPTAIAKNMIKGSYDITGSDRRDNISAAVMIIDPENLPKHTTTMLVADGNGPEGRKISAAVRNSFDKNTLAITEDPLLEVNKIFESMEDLPPIEDFPPTHREQESYNFSKPYEKDYYSPTKAEQNALEAINNLRRSQGKDPLDLSTSFGETQEDGVDYSVSGGTDANENAQALMKIASTLPFLVKSPKLGALLLGGAALTYGAVHVYKWSQSAENTKKIESLTSHFSKATKGVAEMFHRVFPGFKPTPLGQDL